MKHLKRFDEELDLKTYRDAASRLDYYNKAKRASTLYDYADEKEHGFFNMSFAQIGPNTTATVENSTFTDPKITAIYFGGYDSMSSENDSLKYGNDSEKLADDLVSGWIEGRKSLAISFEFGFKATRKTKNDYSNLGFLTSNQRPDKTPIYNHIPAFSLEISLSEWVDGLEEWDSEAKWEAERNGEEFTPSDLYKFYDWSKTQDLYLYKPNNNYGGLFTDRSSANKFKNWLGSQLDGKIKDTIMDVFRIVGGDSEDLDKVLNKIKNIRTVALYDDEIVPRMNYNFNQKWFGKTIR